MEQQKFNTLVWRFEPFMQSIIFNLLYGNEITDELDRMVVFDSLEKITGAIGEIHSKVFDPKTDVDYYLIDITLSTHTILWLIDEIFFIYDSKDLDTLPRIEEFYDLCMQFIDFTEELKLLGVVYPRTKYIHSKEIEPKLDIVKNKD